MIILRKFFNVLQRTNRVGLENEKPRQQWVEKVLTDLPTGLRLLDAGAGEQQYKKYCSHLDYVSQDFAQYDGQGDTSGLQTGSWDNSGLDIVCDITDIPEPDASFDVIVCTEVFEHLPNPVLALQEFSRLLKKDGQLILTAPFCSLTHFAPYHFCTGFNKYFYEKNLGDCGFDLQVIETNGNYFEYIAQEIRRIEDVAMKFSHKKHPNIFQRMSIFVLLGMLRKMSATDDGSQDILCFGYHVVAGKR